MSDPVFADLVMHTISEARRVEKRFDMWKNMLDVVLGKQDERGPRVFPREIKEDLYGADATCVHCKNKIQDIDDAHVHHKTSWAQGGKTVKSNAELLHRYCNQSIGADS